MKKALKVLIIAIAAVASYSCEQSIENNTLDIQKNGFKLIADVDSEITKTVLSGTSTDFVDLIELEHAFVIVPTHRIEDTHAETIWEPVTRWRTFPKSIGYNSVIMVILEDELRIYLVDGLDGLLYSSKEIKEIRGL